LIPDGCCIFPNDGRIVLIEVARTSEYDGGDGSATTCLEKKFQEKEEKYLDLCKELAEVATSMEIIQATFIIGIKGTIMEKQWIENLKMLKIEDEMEQVITDCIIQELEAQHMLWIAKKKEGNQGRPRKAGPREAGTRRSKGARYRHATKGEKRLK